MCPSDLLNIYKTVLRPFAEYSHVVYDSLIPEYMSEKLESVQKQAMKIIYGWDMDYDKLIEDGMIETLKTRRKDAVLKFAIKTAASQRFGPNWYKETPETYMQMRPSTRNRYIEKNYRTDRGKNNPLHVMTKRLNALHKNSI